MWIYSVCFFFQAEDGIRDLVRSRGLGDVYKRQEERNDRETESEELHGLPFYPRPSGASRPGARARACLLYTSDAADERSSVDLGGRRIIKKKKQEPRSDGDIQGHKKKKQ